MRNNNRVQLPGGLPLNILKDIVEVNKEVSIKTFAALKACPVLIPITVGVLLVNVMIAMAAGFFGFLAGLFLLIADGAVLGAYLYALEQVIRYRKLKIQDLQYGIQVYFRRTVIMIMIINLAFYALSILGGILSGLGFVVMMIGYLGAFIFLNPLPEMLYLRHYSEGESLSKSYEFVMENWIDWFIPLLPMMILAFGGGIFGGMLFPGLGTLPGILIQAIVLPFVMVYRGFLFDNLSKSSRRKRQFRRNMH